MHCEWHHTTYPHTHAHAHTRTYRCTHITYVISSAAPPVDFQRCVPAGWQTPPQLRPSTYTWPSRSPSVHSIQMWHQTPEERRQECSPTCYLCFYEQLSFCGCLTGPPSLLVSLAVKEVGRFAAALEGKLGSAGRSLLPLAAVSALVD